MQRCDMLASLIPFFLVAKVPVDDGIWKYGIEYVFDVEINKTLSQIDQHGVQTSCYTVMNLFCRQKGTDELNCHLGNIRQQDLNITNGKIDVADKTVNNKIYREHPFEIKFSEDGIQYLIVDYHIAVDELNELKLIAGCLNIGVNLNGIPDGTFETVEQSTIGQCNTTVGINHSPSKGSLNKMKRHRYELESLPRLNKVPGEAVVIQKTTNLDNCTHYAPFYYGTYGGNVAVEPDLPSHLISSSNRIFVSDFQFVSSLSRISTMGSDKTNNLAATWQYVSLSLRDIREAKREIVKVSTPSRTTIMANSEVKKIYDEK